MEVHFADAEVHAGTEVWPGTTSAVFAWNEEDERNQRWRKAFRDLQRCDGLAVDWDGEGGVPPDARVLFVARSQLTRWYESSHNSPPVRILPTSSGSILIEWQEPNHYVEAEITKSGEIEWMRIDGDAPATHWVTHKGIRSQYDFGNWEHTTLNPTMFTATEPYRRDARNSWMNETL